MLRAEPGQMLGLSSDIVNHTLTLDKVEALSHQQVGEQAVTCHQSKLLLSSPDLHHAEAVTGRRC